MHFTKRSITFPLCVLLCASFALAQNNNHDAQSGKANARDVTIIIQQQQLRFAAPASAQELRLEVFNKTAEMVYDSGFVAGAELSWKLQNAGGEDITSGLYAYTLTIKDANSETPSTRRGHLILERGRDQLWVTNQGAIGAEESLSGSELTVSSDSEITVAGARPRANAMRKVNNFESFATPTPGQIAKFDDFGFLINSVIKEDALGRIGIGTATPGSALTVAGQIETKSGGIKFPNGSVQTSAGISQVIRNATLTGNGTEAAPLGVNIPALSLLSNVTTNATLTGNGTSASPLGVAVPLSLSGFSASSEILSIVNTGAGNLFSVGARGGAGNSGSAGGGAVSGIGGNSTGLIAGNGVRGIGGNNTGPAGPPGTGIGNGGDGVEAIGGNSFNSFGGHGIVARAGLGVLGNGLAGRFTGGNIAITGSGLGVILKSPNGATCRLLSIDDAGAIVLTAIGCP